MTMNTASRKITSQTDIPKKKMDPCYVYIKCFTQHFLGSLESTDSEVARETIRHNLPSARQITKPQVKLFLEYSNSLEIKGVSHIGIQSVQVQEDSLAQADEGISPFNKYSLVDISFFGCDGQVQESSQMQDDGMPNMDSHSSYPPTEYEMEEDEEEEILYSFDCSFSQLDIEKPKRIPSLFQIETPNDEVTIEKCLHKCIYQSFNNLSCKEQLLEDLAIEEISSFTQLAYFFQTQSKTKRQTVQHRSSLPTMKYDYELEDSGLRIIGDKTASKRSQQASGQLTYNTRPTKSCVLMPTSRFDGFDSYQMPGN